MRVVLSFALAAAVSACSGGAQSGAYATGVALPPATPRPLNLDCPEVAERCPLFTGTTTYTQIPGDYLALVNSTSQSIQIDSIQGVELNGSGGFGEYGAALDTFSTDQIAPNNGEVEYVSKESGYTYAPLVWSDSSEATALSVPPNHVLFVHSNDAANYNTWEFTVTAEAQTALGVQSWRQPQKDQVIPCDGTARSTVWSPWQNTTGKTLYLHGAMIYAPNQVDAATAYILDSSGNARWTYSQNMTVQGTLAFPGAQQIKPNESLAAKATFACSTGQWDWAAFFYVSDRP